MSSSTLIPFFLPKDRVLPHLSAPADQTSRLGACLGGDRAKRVYDAQGTREFFGHEQRSFRTEQELHEHYRSAFHRYNLKRRGLVL